MIWTRIMEKLFNLPIQSCSSCETLKMMLERQLDINRELTNSIIKPQVIESKPMEDMKPISPNYTPWRVRQQMLQNEDRAKAAILRKTNDELQQAIMGNPSPPDSNSGGGAIPS